MKKNTTQTQSVDTPNEIEPVNMKWPTWLKQRATVHADTVKGTNLTEWVKRLVVDALEAHDNKTALAAKVAAISALEDEGAASLASRTTPQTPQRR